MVSEWNFRKGLRLFIPLTIWCCQCQPMSFILRARSVHDPDQPVEHLYWDPKTRVLLDSAVVYVDDRKMLYLLKLRLKSIGAWRFNKYATARTLFYLRLLQHHRAWADYDANAISDFWDEIVLYLNTLASAKATLNHNECFHLCLWWYNWFIHVFLACLYVANKNTLTTTTLGYAVSTYA